MQFDKDLQSIQEVRDLVAQARQAQRVLARMSQEQLDKLTAAVSVTGAEHARRLADMAVEETGFGRKADKELKNRFAALTLYDAIRDERTHGVLAENREKRVVDIGVPVGVVAGLVPSTNPTSTVIYKTMICMKAGNPIIFSPHPSAVNCITETVNVLRRAVEAAGGPAGAVSCVTTPTMEATEALMKHEHVRLILATGGSAMVKAAYSSGTPAIGVGAATVRPISTPPPTYSRRSSGFWIPRPSITAPSAPASSLSSWPGPRRGPSPPPCGTRGPTSWTGRSRKSWPASSSGPTAP